MCWVMQFAMSNGVMSSKHLPEHRHSMSKKHYEPDTWFTCGRVESLATFIPVQLRKPCQRLKI